MAHVSKIPLKDTIRRKISSNLMRTLFANTVHGKTVLPSLLTKTERLMLAKRLAIIIMIEKDYSSYEIWKTLKVSTSTIQRYERQIDAGMYDVILSTVRKAKGSLSILEIIELIASAGLPPIAGSRDNKRIKRIREKWNVSRM